MWFKCVILSRFVKTGKGFALLFLRRTMTLDLQGFRSFQADVASDFNENFGSSTKCGLKIHIAFTGSIWSSDEV